MAENERGLFFLRDRLNQLDHPYFRQSAIVFLLSLMGGVLNLACRIVLGRMLTGEQYGEMETALQFGSYLMMPLSTLNLFLIRQVAEADGLGDPARIQSAVRILGGWILLYGGGSAIGLVVLGPWLRDWFRYHSLWPFLATATLGVTTSALLVGAALLQGTRQFWRNGFVGLAGPSVRIVASWGLVGLGYGATGAIAALSISNVVMGVVSLFLILPLLRPWRPSAEVSQRVLGRALVPLTLIFWMGGILGGVDLFFVKRVFDPWIAGDYARVSAVVRQGLMLNGFLAVTLFPWVAAEKAGGRSTQHLLLRALGVAGGMALGMAVVFTLFPGLILRLFYGEVSERMLQWTPRLAWALVPGSLIPLLIQYVLARGEYRALLIVWPAVGLYLFLLGAFCDSIEAIIPAVGFGLLAIAALMTWRILRVQCAAESSSRQAATSTPSDSSV